METGMAAALSSLSYCYESVSRLVGRPGPMPRSRSSGQHNDAFDDNSRLTKANNVVLRYDSKAKLISDGSRTDVWDDRNWLIQIKSSSTVIAGFNYDALGRRIANTEGGMTTNYLYEGPDAVQETRGAMLNRF